MEEKILILLIGMVQGAILYKHFHQGLWDLWIAVKNYFANLLN